MAAYAHATAVVLTVPYEDQIGNSITPVSGTFRVLDETETEIKASASIGAISGSSSSISVAAQYNTLEDDVTRGYRTVEISFVTAAGTVVVTHGYIVEKATTLEVMENSYQTYGEAMMVAEDMPGLTSWGLKTERERKAALTDAFHRLGTLTYYIKDRWQYQDRISDIWDGETVVQLNEYTAAEFTALHNRFRSALKRAQVVEADVILGGDTIGDTRRVGLMSQSIGETSQFFRPTKPVVMAVSDKALRQLQGFVRFSMKSART
jgi:hypothetical protein